VTRKEFKFAAKHNLPFFFVSAADGTNIVKVILVNEISFWPLVPPVLCGVSSSVNTTPYIKRQE
jgi:hypothetical protein